MHTYVPLTQQLGVIHEFTKGLTGFWQILSSIALDCARRRLDFAGILHALGCHQSRCRQSSLDFLENQLAKSIGS